jgi:hypothetical protein
LRRDLRADAAALAALILFVAAFWGRFLAGRLVFYARDLGFFFAPLRAAFAHALREGAPPLWNAWLGGGIPMAADPNAGAFFPGTLLFLLRPFSQAVRVNGMVWIFALPLAAYAGLRRLGVSRGSSAVGAATLAVCGPAMTWTSLPSTSWAFVFILPLLALAAGRGGRRTAIAAGGLLGLVILVGEPAIALQALCAAAFLCAFPPEGRLRWRRFAGIAATGLLIAAPQVAGALELLGQSVRGRGLPLRFGPAFYSVRPARLFGVLWPGLFGDVQSPLAGGFWGRAFFDAGAPYVTTLALGTVTLALLPAAARSRLGRRLLALAGLATVLSFGRFLPGGDLLLSLPGLSLLRYPEKWLFLASVAAVAAAATGIDSLARGDAGARKAFAIGCGAIAAVSGAAAALLRAAPGASIRALESARVVDPRFSTRATWVLERISSDVGQVALFSLLGLGAAYLLGRPRRARLAPVVLGLLILADLAPRTWNWVPLAPPSYYDDPPKAAQAVLGRGGRLYYGEEREVAEDPLRPMHAVVWGVAYDGNNDIDRFSPRRSFLFGVDAAGMSFSDPRKARLLRLAGVSTVSTIDPSARTAAGLSPILETSPVRTLYGLAGSRRLRLLYRAEAVRDEEEARGRILAPGFEPDAVAVLEGAEGLPGVEGTGRILPVGRRADAETAVIETSEPAVLVRSETYDPHWLATIDGAPARIYPADFSFQAILVPKGRHRVAFRYVDGTIAVSMLVSILALAFCIAVLSGRPARGGPSSRTR